MIMCPDNTNKNSTVPPNGVVAAVAAESYIRAKALSSPSITVPNIHPGLDPEPAPALREKFDDKVYKLGMKYNYIMANAMGKDYYNRYTKEEFDKAANSHDIIMPKDVYDSVDRAYTAMEHGKESSEDYINNCIKSRNLFDLVIYEKVRCKALTDGSKLPDITNIPGINDTVGAGKFIEVHL